MMKRLVTSLAFVLLSTNSFAEDINSVKVWHDSEKAVFDFNYTLAPSTQIMVYDFSARRKAERKINDDLQARGVRYTGSADENLKIAQDAFQNYMNTPDFQKAQDAFRQLGQSLESAVEFEVLSAPTIVINDKYKIVGVYNLAEAVSIFRQKVE